MIHTFLRNQDVMEFAGQGNYCVDAVINMDDGLDQALQHWASVVEFEFY